MLIHVHLLVVPLLLLLAAIFAASEASLFSLTRSDLESLRDDRPTLYRRMRPLIYRPDETLSTLIIGNEFINILLGTLVTGFIELQWGIKDLYTIVFLSVTISAGLLLACSEVLPKIIAFRMPLVIASILVFPLSWAHQVMTPVRRVFLGISRRILRLLGVQTAPPTAINEQDFLTLVEVGAESGSLDHDERDLITNVFTFSDLDVTAIMTPWGKVFTLTDDLSTEEVLKNTRKQNFSRIPVISKLHGHVVGILYSKALLKLLITPEEDRDKDHISRATFPPYIVSSHKKVARLFRELKTKKIHIAIVVDEFGKQIGVVTLEDVLNSIFRRKSKEKVEEQIL